MIPLDGSGPPTHPGQLADQTVTAVMNVHNGQTVDVIEDRAPAVGRPWPAPRRTDRSDPEWTTVNRRPTRTPAADHRPDATRTAARPELDPRNAHPIGTAEPADRSQRRWDSPLSERPDAVRSDRNELRPTDRTDLNGRPGPTDRPTHRDAPIRRPHRSADRTGGTDRHRCRIRDAYDRTDRRTGRSNRGSERPTTSDRRTALQRVGRLRDRAFDRPPDAFAAARIRTISTTMAGGSIRSWPHRRTTGGPPPSRAMSAAWVVTSSTANSPLSASIRPPSAARGRHHAVSRSRGATARAVTTSAGASPG